MSDTSAKAVRAARDAKAKRLGSAGDPKQKVDASTWTPPEMMNTEAKTGLRPVSRRQFKSGGKVGMMAEGSCGPMRADRKPRKAGGSAKSYIDAKINRNVKEANAELGKPHVGGMKNGGRMKRADGGNADPRMMKDQPSVPTTRMGFQPVESRVGQMVGMKKGGKVKKAEGGELAPPRGTSGRIHDAMRNAHGYAGNEAAPDAVGHYEAPPDAVGYYEEPKRRRPTSRSGLVNLLSEPGGGMKKGGKVGKMEWEHSKADLEQDKKLAKKHGMKMEAWEKSKLDEKHDKQQSPKGLATGGREARAYGGGLFGDKKKSTKGGKGKTNIVISINAGGQQPGAMPPRPPQGVPVPVPPPPPPGGMPPMPMPPPGPPPGMPPMPMPPPGGPGGMMPPMGRKAGGRIYPKMHAGAGSGEGRLEKIDAYGLKPPRK